MLFPGASGEAAPGGDGRQNAGVRVVGHGAGRAHLAEHVDGPGGGGREIEIVARLQRDVLGQVAV